MELKGNLNMRRAFLTEEQQKEDKKEYYQDNKEQKKEYDKEYYQDNKEKRTKQMKEYYEGNKEIIKEHKNEKHNCPCGGRYTWGSKTQHFKTKMHCDFINSQQ